MGQGLLAWDVLVLPAQVFPLQSKGALGSFHQETPKDLGKCCQEHKNMNSRDWKN